MIPQLAPGELAAWCNDPARAAPLVVDVRDARERAVCEIAGSLWVPLAEIRTRMADLPRERELVLVCHKGMRSFMAASLLAAEGYSVHNLRGGIAAWAETVEPSMPRY